MFLQIKLFQIKLQNSKNTYPAHVVRFVDSIISAAVLTETKEYCVYGHLINTNEGVGNQVGK